MNPSRTSRSQKVGGFRRSDERSVIRHGDVGRRCAFPTYNYGIIQKHHGRIEVHSEVGKGTTFRVCLPVKRPQVEEARP